MEVRDPEFRLYRNGELILEEAAVYHPMSDDIPHCYYLREVNEDGLGQTIPVDAQPGDDTTAGLRLPGSVRPCL